jgi:hypothetical protein
MSEAGEMLTLHLDLLPNLPKNEQTRDQNRDMLRDRFENRLPEAVERIWDLPPMMVRAEGDYLTLLLEARELYVLGYFYSCVAMCGIVGERLIKDAIRTSVLIQTETGVAAPSAAAFDQLERVEVSAMIRFLKETGLLKPEAGKAAEELGQLRNQYAHARGKQPQPDALRAVKLLHSLVDDTVSIFKHYTIKEGTFVRRTAPA